MSKIVETVKSLAEPLLSNLGYELVDVEYRKERQGYVLRLFIDSPNGVGLDDCEAASRAVESELDRLDLIPHSYNLEVSSPGLERPLKKEEDFRRFQGRTAFIRTFAAFEGRRRFQGRLEGVGPEGVKIVTAEGTYILPLNQIASARLVIDF
ncbi:MAG: ribosome maturation factor RimP [Clostridia bacterium]|nr:ribosome maturation factor RimP [Clostridia bacterium]